MLLQDLGINSQAKIGKINQFLSSKYGIKISESTDTNYLIGLKNDLSARIQRLRIEGLTPKDAEFSKELLVLEGINTLIEYRTENHQELPHGPYRRVLDNLSDDVVHDIQIGDSYEEAMESAMKSYRSSIYRFNDDMVRSDLENRVKDFLRKEYTSMTEPEASVVDGVIGEAGDIEVADAQDTTPREVKVQALKAVVAELVSWSNDLRSTVSQTWSHHRDNVVKDALRTVMRQNISGQQVDWDELAKELTNFISNKFDSAGYDLGPDDLEKVELDEYDYRKDAPVNRKDREPISKDIQDRGTSYLAKHGTKDLALEPMGAPGPHGRETFNRSPRKNTKEGLNMSESKENYIKRLRTILENEVVQAEVLVAAKSFGQEIQVMIEKIGRLTNEDLGPVVDQMRGAFGTQEAASFQDSMRSEMEAVLQNLRSVKEKIDDSVEKLASGGVPGMDTDMDADMGGDVGADIGTGDVDMGAGDVDMTPTDDLGVDPGFEDEFGGVEDEPLGRPAKESIENLRAELNKLREQVEAKKRKVK